MRSSSIRLRTVFFLCACGLLLAPITADDSPPADVQQLDREIQDLEYELSWKEAPQLRDVESSWQAPNRAHGIRTYFTGDGLRVHPRVESQASQWQIGFSLIGYGRDASVVGVDPAELVADGKRIEYQRGRIAEWYVNDFQGLEQGFDLVDPPAAAGRSGRFVPGARRVGADGEAYLVLTIEGSLSPRIGTDGRSIDFATTSGGVSILHYGQLVVRDAKDQLLPSWLEGFAEAGIRGLRIVFDDTDAVYPVTVDPLLTSAAWSVESDQAGASLGISVAGAGDVNHDGWDDVIVGASAYDAGPYANAGRVFVYYGSASGLSTAPDWSAEADSVDAGFGYAVRAGGDLNDDGKDDLVIGSAFFDGIAGTNAGAVYVYYGPLQDKVCGDTGAGEALCLPANADWAIEGDAQHVHLGAAVDAAGDVSGDGNDDLIIGSNYGNKVYVIYGPLQDKACGDVPGGEARCLPDVADWTAIESSQPGTYRSRFGASVAAAGNVNGDPFDDIIIGALWHDNGQTDEGRAYVFLGPLQDMACGEVMGVVPEPPCAPDVDSDWTAEGDQSYAEFGVSVASAGDVNGDGFDDIIVGASGFDNVGWNYGQARVYHGSVLGPAQTAAWVAGSDLLEAEYGISVAAAGDVNLDGYDDVIVGAHLYDGGGTNEGRAYVYEGSPTGLAPGEAWSWSAEGNQFSAQFGRSVAGAGDVNGDGYDDVIVGAPYHSHGQEGEGRASLYYGAPKVTGWTLASQLGLQPLQIRSASWSIRSGAAADPMPITATPEAVSHGPVPQSVLLTTGRVTDRDLAAAFPETKTGIEDVDWGEDGLGDTATFELDVNIPPWAETIRFTTQYLTNEIGENYGGDPYDSDSAQFEFYFNGWSRDRYPLDDPARWVANSPVSHCINVVGGSRVTLVFTVEDVDGSDDSGLLISRVFFSTLPFPPDITLDNDGVDGNGDGYVDYFSNPAPHDVSLSSGTYSFTKDLFSIPGLSMPFRFAIVYNSQADRSGTLGRKWTHSYDGYAEEIKTDEDGNGSAETLSAILVRHGAGTAEYFEPEDPTGFRPKYPGSHSTLSGSAGNYTLVTQEHLTYQFTEPGDTPEVTLLTRVTDANDNRFDLAYESRSGKKKITGVTDTRGELIEFLYTNGRLSSMEYAWQTPDEPPQSVLSTVGFAYDLSTNDLASITDINGHTTTFDYDRQGNLLSITDGDGVTQVANSFEQYQGIDLLQVGDRLVSQRDAKDQDPFDPEGGVSYRYDGEALHQIDRLGNEDTRLFDVKGRMARRIDPTGVSWEYLFDRHGNIVETWRKLPGEERLRVVAVASYDDAGNLLSKTEFPGTCVGGARIREGCSDDSDCPGSSCGVHQSATYDIFGNLRTSSDHLGNTTTFIYDANHNLVSTTDPLGHTVRQSYSPSGQAISTTDARGHSSNATYDSPLQKPTRVYNPVDADGSGQLDFVEYAYDALGHAVSITDPNGNRTVFAYDDAGRLLSETDALGNTTQRTYDAAGRVLSTRDANGAIRGFLYTRTGRLMQETDPLGSTTTYAYDDEDRLVSATDPAGRSMRYAYDSGGRLTFVESCDAASTSCLHASAGFDEVGNLARLEDSSGNETWFEYDLMGRVTRETDELGHFTTYGYDGRGLLAAFTNARGQSITYQYDRAGRQTGFEFSGSSVVHTLDADGNPISSVSDRFAGVSRTFDELDRMVERTDEFGNTVRYNHDPAGNLRALSYPDGSKVVYSYDALNRMVRIEDWYDPANRPPDPAVVGACEASAYCRLTTYGYDAVGNLTTTNLPDNSTVTSVYDLAGRPTHVSDTHPGTGTIFAASYTHDEVGLLTASSVTLPLDPQIDTSSEDLGYNELNQVVSRGADSYAYDLDGNLVSGALDGAAITATYDELNQLVQLGADTFRYDVDGHRVEVTRAGETRRYVYDPAAELPRLLEEFDSDGNLVARYVYGVGLVSREGAQGQDYRIYHFDNRGSTVALTDGSGTVTDVYAYDPYGAPAGYEDPTPGDPPTPNPFRFNGRDGVIDDGNGLYYMRARYYAPELMRFIQQDAAPTGLSDPQSVNRYAYVRGNPIQFVDPDGNWFGIDDLIATVVGAVVGAVTQGVECLTGGDCGWEDWTGAIVAGAATGALSLYISPAAAGAIGGALDAGLTWGLKAIPGFAEAESWKDGLFDVVTGAALGTVGGKPGGGGVSQLTSRLAPTKHLDALRETGINKVSKLGSRYVKQHWGGQVIKEIVVGGARDALSGAGVTAASGGVSRVWNQARDPLADAWDEASLRGLFQYAWRP